MYSITPIRAARRLIHDLRANKRGNVLMLLAFSAVPLTLAGGVAVDYARAARLQTKLNAAADAASLAAVSQEMMKQDNPAAKNAALAMFKSQISGQSGLVWNDSDLAVDIQGNNSATTTRTAVVSYTAKSTNAFAGLLGIGFVTIGGSATATATAAPNIDFYLALDTSASMALPTTTAGFNIMDAPLKCAFACHSNKIQQYAPPAAGNPPSLPTLILDNALFSIVKDASFGIVGTGATQIQKIDAAGTFIYTTATTTKSECKGPSNKDICIYNADGSYVDSYWYALNKGVRLRVTDERIAARDLMTLAKSYAAQNSRTYRAALYTFDHSTNLKTISTLSSDLDAVGSAASNVDLVTINDKAGNGRPPNGTSGTEYLFTSFNSIMTHLLNVLPAQSGKGSNDATDTPQAFVFMVTDGMSDENIGSGRTRAAMQAAQITQCNTIKNRGIQIAILYTEYTVESIKDDEAGQKAIATAAIPNIAPQLIKCASPGLMYTVKTDQSISDALQALFSRAVSSARLSN